MLTNNRKKTILYSNVIFNVPRWQGKLISKHHANILRIRL